MVHWADVKAGEVAAKGERNVLATAITPSGPIHIGNMREVLTTDAVYKALLHRGGVDAELIYIADDYDHLRKVYPFLDEEVYSKYVGMPLAEIPCPCGKHKSYSEHFLEPFLKALSELGIKPRVLRAYEMYNSGAYKDAIVAAMENMNGIRDIIERVSKRQLPKNWIPFNVQCQSCRKLTATRAIFYEFPYIEYECDCGHKSRIDIRENGVGKLAWRVDWPARWSFLGVTFEAFGKDHAAAGGSWDTGKEIVASVYEYPYPEHLVYEFIQLKGQGAMHSSTGTSVSAEQMLKMTPPEVLRFLLMSRQPGKHIDFDPGLGILSLVDEYDEYEKSYFGATEERAGMKDQTRTYELSQPGGVPSALPVHIPYRHLVTVVQIADDFEGVREILARSGAIPKNMGEKDLKRLEERSEHARYWVQNFAPDMVRFELTADKPDVEMGDAGKRFLSKAADTLENEKLAWTGESIHDAVYEDAQKLGLNPKEAFAPIYLALLGKERGPRAGHFLSSLERKFVVKRFREFSS
ncbi:MAG: lysine--tRNA ligase [Thermoplasmata archaeon HGW-Thermoplasmata-1]|nr:MAG: lysine--tRNA ligase [Thermoplasmata archaeon HGW-Thermoplasmata-1]